MKMICPKAKGCDSRSECPCAVPHEKHSPCWGGVFCIDGWISRPACIPVPQPRIDEEDGGPCLSA